MFSTGYMILRGILTLGQTKSKSGSFIMTVTGCMEALSFGLPVQHQLRGVAAIGSNTFKYGLTNVFGSPHLSYSIFNLYSTLNGTINFLSSVSPKRI